MIVTVTLNPALLVSYETKQITRGAPNEVSRVQYRPGGRGLTVARVLHTFGHEVVAAGLAGGASGEAIREGLAHDGVPTQFTWISGECRRVLEVTDESDGSVTGFGEPAPYITTEELGRLAADYRSLMGDASAAVLSGSLPAGLPAEIYGSLARYAAESGVPVILDADSRPLWLALARQPALIIPGTEDAADPGRLLASGAKAVALVSAAGASVVTGQGSWTAAFSGVQPAAASRAAMVAGLVPGTVLGWSWPDTLAHALALSAATMPDDKVDLDRYERLLPQVAVSQ